MHHLVVDRRAEGLGIVSIPFKGRHSTARANELFGQSVQLLRRDARTHLPLQGLQCLGNQFGRFRHHLDFVLSLEDDHDSPRAASSSTIRLCTASTEPDPSSSDRSPFRR